jgi:hypothetical protein
MKTPGFQDHWNPRAFMLIYDPEKSKRPQLLVHKDYKGRLPLCYYATGLQEGGLHNMDACLDTSKT